MLSYTCKEITIVIKYIRGIKMKKIEKFTDKQQHFSIRKLTIGAVSVLLGTSLWIGGNVSVAHADTVDAENSSLVKKSEATTDSNATQSDSNTQVSDNIENNEKNSEVKAINTNSVHDSKQPEEQINKKIETVETKENTIQKQPTVTSNKEVETQATDDANKTYNVTVTLKNVSRDDGNLNLNPNWPINRGWTYNFKDQVITLTNVKNGTRVYSLGVAPVGFKLVNPEVLEQNFRMDGNTAYVDGKDANVTLEYAAISPILVKYVDAETGEVLSSSSVGANTSSSASREYELGDKTAVGPSKFLVQAIDIPGYELVKDGPNQIIERYNNLQSVSDLNYQVVTFKYKKVMNNLNPKGDKGSGAQYGEYFGPQWNTIDPADVFTLSGVKGQTYEKDNGDMEAKIKNIVKKYNNQGYTYIGTFNYHTNTDYYNWNEAATSINLVPNKPVTVKFVDEKGNKLADDETIAFNKNNSDQTNNGINETKHWYSGGEWTATPKTFDGYTLRTTYGATKGQFTPYSYIVTFEYAKDATGKVTYIDDDAESTKNVLKTDSLTGFVGDKIDYSTSSSIADYEKQGYVLVSDNFSADKTYQEDASDNSFEVHFKHGVKPVTPDTPTPDVPKTPDGKTVVNPTDLTKKVSLTVNYVNADGTQFTGAVPENAKQTATFTGVAYVDTVTGQLVNAKQENGSWVIDSSNTATPAITWTADKTSFEGVTSPAQAGYHVTNVSSHADGNNVAAITGLTKDSNNIDVTVTYAKNGTETRNDQKINTRATVHYEGAGDLTPKDNIQDGFVFEYSGDVYDKVTGEKISDGKWNADSHAYKAVTIPVIEGYHAEINGKTVTEISAADLTVTRDNPDARVTVTYVKNGTEVKNQQEFKASQLVKYVDQDGNEISPSKSQEFTFTYSGDVYDKVTGKKISDGKWNVTSHDFTAENVPAINGYELVSGYTTKDGVNIAGGFNVTTATAEKDRNKVFTVVFKKASTPVTPVTPDKPSPKPQPETPDTPTPTPDVPDTPSPQPHPQPTPEVPDVPAPHGEDVPTTPSTAKKNTPAPAPHAVELPQTGSRDNTVEVIAGGIASLLGLVGLAGISKKRRKD